MERQLAKLLGPDGFRGTKRESQFLNFVAQAAIDEVPMTEKIIGDHMFGNYDGLVSNGVRVCAHHVRKKLASYYAGPGQGDYLIATLLPGKAYRVEFALNPKASLWKDPDRRGPPPGTQRPRSTPVHVAVAVKLQSPPSKIESARLKLLAAKFAQVVVSANASGEAEVFDAAGARAQANRTGTTKPVSPVKRFKQAVIRLDGPDYKVRAIGKGRAGAPSSPKKPGKGK